MRNLLDVAVANQAERVASAALRAARPGGEDGGEKVVPPTTDELVTLGPEDLPPLMDHPEELYGLYL